MRGQLRSSGRVSLATRGEFKQSRCYGSEWPLPAYGDRSGSVSRWSRGDLLGLEGPIFYLGRQRREEGEREWPEQFRGPIRCCTCRDFNPRERFLIHFQSSELRPAKLDSSCPGWRRGPACVISQQAASQHRKALKRARWQSCLPRIVLFRQSSSLVLPKGPVSLCGAASYRDVYESGCFR